MSRRKKTHEIINKAIVLARTECQNFLHAQFSSSPFVVTEWNQAQTRPTGTCADPVTGAVALQWCSAAWRRKHGATQAARWSLPASRSVGCLGAWATTVNLVKKPPEFNGIYQKCSSQTRTANNINVNVLGNTAKKKMAGYRCRGSNLALLLPTQIPGLRTLDLDSVLCLPCAWGHRHMQSLKHCKETNKDLSEKKTHILIWRFSEMTVCLQTWLRKITFFSSDLYMLRMLSADRCTI